MKMLSTSTLSHLVGGATRRSEFSFRTFHSFQDLMTSSDVFIFSGPNGELLKATPVALFDENGDLISKDSRFMKNNPTFSCSQCINISSYDQVFQSRVVVEW